MEELGTYEQQQVRIKWFDLDQGTLSTRTMTRNVELVEAVGVRQVNGTMRIHLKGVVQFDYSPIVVHAFADEHGNDPEIWHVDQKRAEELNQKETSQ